MSVQELLQSTDQSNLFPPMFLFSMDKAAEEDFIKVREWEKCLHDQLAQFAKKMNNLKLHLGIKVGNQKLILPQDFMPGVN